jgi:hypothetical protein
MARVNALRRIAAIMPDRPLSPSGVENVTEVPVGAARQHSGPQRGDAGARGRTPPAEVDEVSSRHPLTSGLRWKVPVTDGVPSADEIVDQTGRLEPAMLDHLIALTRGSTPALEHRSPPAQLLSSSLDTMSSPSPASPRAWQTVHLDAPPSSPWWRWDILVAASVMVVLLGAVAGVLLRPAEPPPPQPPPPAAEPVPEPEVVAPAPPVLDNRGAPEALSLLREGIRRCVLTALGTLPGSSPAVPARLAQVGGAGFTAPPADWQTPVWKCAGFHVDGPVRFQLQWQLVTPSTAGVAVAWIDDDGDGAADRAFAFEVRLPRKGALEMGDITPADPARPVLHIPDARVATEHLGHNAGAKGKRR